MQSSKMFVVKRSGNTEPVFFDKITNRNEKLCKDLQVDAIEITQKVIQNMKSGMKTEELDNLSAETALYHSTYEPDYEIMAKRIVISNSHKIIPASFFSSTMKLHELDLLDEEYFAFVCEKKAELDAMIDHARDYDMSYFGYKTMEKSYLTKDRKGLILERVQHVFMRTAAFLHFPDLEKIKTTYDLMSQKYFIHASPTLFNSGLKRPQLASCFLLSTEDDLNEMLTTLTRAGMISKFSGGIGINLSMIRSKGSFITSTGGQSDGVVPYLKLWNSLARYVNQGGRRKGAVAVYIEPHHADISDFLKIRKNNTKEEIRCPDLHIGLWISDLFMKRVINKETWSLFDPNRLKQHNISLHDCYGEEYEQLYLRAEQEKLYETQVNAQDLFTEILFSHMETGEPYMLFKDHINHRSNQKNIGVIRGSNLCTEITEYTDKETVSVCNLCSVSLPAFVNKETRTFDFKKLGEVVETITENLNIVIDKNFYPIPAAQTSNFQNRPIGIGASGLADVFQMLGYAWEDHEARQLNTNIYATIYFHSLKKSVHLAKLKGPYEKFNGSPFSQGLLQQDLARMHPSVKTEDAPITISLDWDKLRADIMAFGTRNSLLTTQMPTASTAQIIGNNESMEPYTSNMYARSVLSGTFPVINIHLYNDLKSLGLWNVNMVNDIITHGGSIQNIATIPQRLKNIYKTSWELSVKTMIDYAVDRGNYIDQSQSFNVFMETPTVPKMSSMFKYSWEKGMKTGMYYLRRKPQVQAIKITVPLEEEEKKKKPKNFVCTDDVCTSCSS